jgi:hypothetical protein
MDKVVDRWTHMVMIASPHDVENVVAMFDRAAEINREMPGRQGSTVALTPELGDEVMIAGDVHGHRDNFERICQIAALDQNPGRHLVIQEVCHGGPTYPGGGCMSHTVLEDVAELVTRHPTQVHLILGNHELAELADFPICKNNQLLNMSFRIGLRQRYSSASEEVRLALTRFLWSCPLAVRLPQGVLITHSLPDRVDSQGFDPSVLLRDLQRGDGVDGSDVFRLVWGRDYRRQNAQAFAQLTGAKLLITGHEPCEKGFTTPSDLQLILDCCGDNSAYVILPIGVELTQPKILSLIETLGD